MKLPNILLSMASGALVLHGGAANAQFNPNKPIRIIASSPGGSTDMAARLISAGFASTSKQTVIVENQGGGMIPLQSVARAEPDGHTLLAYTSTLWVGPLIEKDTPYSEKDFLPISMVAASPNILVIHPSVQANSVKELIALAKAKPGSMNYGSGGTGASSHTAGELFKSMAGVDLLRIPYKSAAPAIADVVGGRVHIMFATGPVAAPHVKSGKVKALAITTKLPSALAPDLPTVAATVPGFESVAPIGIYAPLKTPAATINRIYQDIAKAVNLPEIKEKFVNAGSEVVAASPAEFAAYIKADVTLLEKVIRDAGIKSE